MAGNGAGLAVLVVFADTGPEDFRADKSGHAADHMYCGGACEIMEAELGEPAAAPDPVTGDRIDKRTDHGAVDAVGDEFGAFRHCAGDNGCRGGAEDGLENRVGPQRDGKSHEAVVALNEEVKPADQRAGTGEHQAKAEEPEDGGTDGKVHQVFHNDVTCVFSSCKTGFNHCKSALHKEHE